MTIYCCLDKSEPLCIYILKWKIFAFYDFFSVRNKCLDKTEDINNEDVIFDSIESETNPGDSNKINKISANQEFKRRLCEQIPKNDPIWSDGDKFDIEKFMKEPYLSKVIKIESNHAKMFLVFLKSGL